MGAKSQLAPRDDIPENDKWNLEGLYTSDADWQPDFDALKKEIPRYKGFKGTLGRSAKRLKACLEFSMNVSRQGEKVATYAHLKADEDKTNSLYQGNLDRVKRVLTRLGEAGSYISSELMSIPQKRMNQFLREKELDFYRFHLEQILRFRKHILSEKEESLLAASTEMSQASGEVFGMLDTADLKLGTVKDEDGVEIQLTHGNFQSFLQNQSRRIRREAFETYYSEYGDHKYTYASLLSNSIKRDIFYARARKYPSVREDALFSENIPTQVYDNLIKTVHKNLTPLYRYFKVRKRVLGVDELHFYDLTVPLTKEVKWRATFNEAVKKITSALGLLGPDYVKTLRKGLLKERWVDRYENKGKRSGAYSSGCYDSNPFILMNFREEDLNAVYTLAHEAGHSLHSHYSKKHQPYLYSDYTIFVAEVASTFNEALLTRYLLQETKDQDMRTYLVGREIDNFRATLYRQTMFAEFEHKTHELAEKGEPLTVETFQTLYRSLLDQYFGKGVLLDEALNLECFRIPHFYSSFYVYKYSTGISAAYSLVDRVLNGGKEELQDYQNFLKAGGSKYPIELLKDAGIDMTSPEPVRKALKRFSSMVDRLDLLTKN